MVLRGTLERESERESVASWVGLDYSLFRIIKTGKDAAPDH